MTLGAGFEQISKVDRMTWDLIGCDPTLPGLQMLGDTRVVMMVGGAGISTVCTMNGK